MSNLKWHTAAHYEKVRHIQDAEATLSPPVSYVANRV